MLSLFYFFVLISSFFELSNASPPIDFSMRKNQTFHEKSHSRTGKLRIISLKNHHHRLNVDQSKRGNSDKDIVFPDQLDGGIPRINGVPKCAKKDDTFCENYEDYPKNQLKNILKRRNELTEFFGKDEEAPVIVNRHGGLEEPVNFLCPSVERTIFPKVAKNKNNKWKYIINQADDGYIQGVRVETCQRKNSPCDLIGEIPLGYVTSCKQKYIYRRLLSVNDVGTPFPDTFKLPSACCCSYKRDMEFFARFSVEKVTEKRKELS